LLRLVGTMPTAVTARAAEHDDGRTGAPGRDGRAPALHFAIGLARAAGGAIIFGLPLLMTMEMWQLGFAMERLRLALLLVATVPLLVGLSHVSGFEETFDAREDVVDAFVACAVGFVVSAVVLAIFGVLEPGMSAGELVGTIALQAVPASIGALLAQSQFGGGGDGATEHGRHDDAPGGADGGEQAERAEERRRPSNYASQIFLMAVGALFLAFNVAPTEEVVLIGHLMSPWHVLALVGASLGVVHAFVYALEFSGQEAAPEGMPSHHVFLRFTVVGYAMVLLVCAYVLWSFGRLDDTAWAERVTTVLVLGFPGSVGAAAARLIL
jgi:putative integral membrane protein (TIGR02587 family)